MPKGILTQFSCGNSQGYQHVSLHVGFDHHFGKNREGTYDNLIELSDLYAFKIEKIRPQNIGEVTISSTKIRNAILTGEFSKVNSYLSCDFSIKGRVVRGNNILKSELYYCVSTQRKWKTGEKTKCTNQKSLNMERTNDEILRRVMEVYQNSNLGISKS